MVLRSHSERRQGGWPLGMGNDGVHGSVGHGTREGGTGDEHLDQIHIRCHSREYDHLVDFPPDLRHGGPQGRSVARVRRCDTSDIRLARLLPHDRSPSSCLPSAGLFMEVWQTHVPATGVPSCARDSKVQHPGLSASHGAVPESHSESAAGASDAEAKRIRIQSGGRKSAEGVKQLRYDNRSWYLWGDEKFEARR